MTWAGKRRLVVFFVFGAIALVFGAIIYLAAFYHAPTCVDGVQNGSEEGVDCGGTCPYLCAAAEEPPTVLFTKAVDNGAGRTDIIALVENKNVAAAAKNVPYTITVYGYDQSLVTRITGTLDLPPGATVPVFVPHIASGQAAVGTAFLAPDAGAIKWYTQASDPRVVPKIANIVLGGSPNAPRVTATLSNAEVRPMPNVAVVAIVRDASGNAIAASRTLIENVPAFGEATATFVWNAAFSGTPVSVQVVPDIPLP